MFSSIAVMLASICSTPDDITIINFPPCHKHTWKDTGYYSKADTKRQSQHTMLKDVRLRKLCSWFPKGSGIQALPKEAQEISQ